MNTQMVKPNGTPKPAPTLKAFLESPSALAKLSEVATRLMKPQDLVRLALMAASRQPDLLKCSHTSIIRALMDAAAMGIAPGGTMGRGYLVPRKNKQTQELEACFDPGWRGLCDIARRSGQVKRIDAKVVYASDHFEYEEGTSQTLKHVPSLGGSERGEIIASYAIAKFADGEMQIEVLPRADIEKIRAVSMAKSGPWAAWFEEMARKSAVRRLCKYLPYDPMLERALEHATEAESGERTVIDVAAIDAERKPRAKVLAETIRAKVAADGAGPAPDAPPSDEGGDATAGPPDIAEREPGDDGDPS